MLAKRTRIFWAIALTVLALFTLVSLISFHPDQVGNASPPGRNLCGIVGATFAHIALGAWGLAAFLVPLIAAGFSWAFFRGYRGRNAALKLTGAILIVPAMAGIIHLIPEYRLVAALLRHWDQSHLTGLGGTLGHLLSGNPVHIEGRSLGGGILVSHLHRTGAFMLLATVVVAGLVLINMGLRELLRNIYYAVHDRMRKPMRTTTHLDQGLPPRPSTPQPMPVPERPTTSVDEVTKRIAAVGASSSLDANDLVERIRRRRRELGDSDEDMEATAHSSRGTSSDAYSERHATEMESLGSLEAQEAALAAEPLSPLRGAMPRSQLPPISDDEEDGDHRPKPASKSKARKPARKGGYALPDINLLQDAPLRRDSEHDKDIQETSAVIENTFLEFNIKLKVVAATRGPVITQYELELIDPGMRVSKVEGFEKDLSLKLGTEGIRIVAPLPNRKTIGIEVPNNLKEPVVMKDLVEELDPDEHVLPLILGRDVLGRPLVGDLAKMPHLLVAGATGMGKSVCMNAMICSILLFREPDLVKFIMVDPKMVELAGYEDIPHLLTPPITDMTKAHAALEWACKTMDERYFALRLAGVRNIADYNQLGDEEINRRLAAKGKDLADLPGIETRMPYIIILVDEYADLMMVNKEVEKSIVRLTAKSRACGIHIILTTQRPSADVVTGLIKSNLPARISFRVADKSNSRVVLDAGGAENLLGKGDMLYLPPGSSTLRRGQGVWVKDEEIEAVINHAKSQGTPEYDESIFRIGAAAMAGGGGSGDENTSDWIQDREFHDAVWSIYKYNKTGADFLRRKCQIGYNKATSYVEKLEDLGFLGPQKGSKGRELLRPWDDWLDLLKDNGVEIDPEMFDCYTDPYR